MMTSLPEWASPGQPRSMSAFVVSGPHHGDWRTVETPRPRPGEVIVSVSAVGLCGTDSHIFTGRSPNVRLGLTPYPWRPGHEWAGTVVAVHSGDPSAITIGDRVVGDPFVNCGQCSVCRNGGRSAYCPNRVEIGVRGDRDGALAEFVRVPTANLSVIPDSIGFAQAVLAEPATTALHALEAARFRPGEPLAVVGTGTLGLIITQVAIAGGSPITAVGIDPVGLALAESIGAEAVRPGEAPASSFGSVVEASGASHGLLEAGRLAAIGGRIGLLGYPAEPTVPVDAALLIVNGVTIETVLGGIDRMGSALRLIERGVIDTHLLIDSVYSHHQAADLFVGLSAPRPRPKIIVDLSGLQPSSNPKPQQEG